MYFVALQMVRAVFGVSRSEEAWAFLSILRPTKMPKTKKIELRHKINSINPNNAIAIVQEFEFIIMLNFVARHSSFFFPPLFFLFFFRGRILIFFFFFFIKIKKKKNNFFFFFFFFKN